MTAPKKTKPAAGRKGRPPRIVNDKKDLKRGTNYVMHHTRHGYSYEAIVVDGKGNKFPMKLTKSGYIDPKDVYNYIHEADRGRSAKAIETDDQKIAKNVYPAKPTPQQLISYHKNPNRFDIEGHDAPKGSATIKAAKPKLSRLKDDETKTAEPKRSTRSKENLDDIFESSDEAMWKKYAGFNKKTGGKVAGRKKKTQSKKKVCKKN